MPIPRPHHANYFELADALERGMYPHSPLPHRTFARGRTALHLQRDPSMRLTIIDAMSKFNLPDLWGALSDFFQHGANNPPLLEAVEHSTSWCPSHSCRNVRIPLESTRIHWNGTRIHQKETGFHRNYYIPAGIELESAGMEYIEWNCLYIYIFAYIY